jgi:hypothetical protein
MSLSCRSLNVSLSPCLYPVAQFYVSRSSGSILMSLSCLSLNVFLVALWMCLPECLYIVAPSQCLSYHVALSMSFMSLYLHVSPSLDFYLHRFPLYSTLILDYIPPLFLTLTLLMNCVTVNKSLCLESLKMLCVRVIRRKIWRPRCPSYRARSTTWRPWASTVPRWWTRTSVSLSYCRH